LHATKFSKHCQEVYEKISHFPNFRHKSVSLAKYELTLPCTKVFFKHWFEQMFPGKYILVDGATPSVQALVIANGSTVAHRCASGNAAESIAELAKSALDECAIELGALDGMAYCSGPGSAIGLRAALLSLKIWQMFSGANPTLLEYGSLDMCLRLNPNADCVCTHGSDGGIILRTKFDQCTMAAKNLVELEAQQFKNIVFLDTRRIRDRQYGEIHAANYTIASANFNVLSLCRGATGELENYVCHSFKKWTGNISRQ
jgi:hypothetical protein